MSDTADTSRMKEELKDDRNITDLWNDALSKYQGIVGVQLRPKFGSVEEMIAHGTEQMNNFRQFRHNKKGEKLRGLFKQNLEYIMKGAQQLAAAAAPVFPPAIAIGTAFTYMLGVRMFIPVEPITVLMRLQACQQVSADYQVITSFFEDMGSFLQRITILESRLPRSPPYRNCLMDVFTSLLEMCGYATMYIEHGRFSEC